MAYASHYYPHPRQPDPGFVADSFLSQLYFSPKLYRYKLSFRDRLSYGYQYGQSWSNDPERRELERAYNEADRYQRHSHGYHPTSYSDASLTRQSGSHYASPHDKHEVVEGTLVRHPTAAAHVDPRSGSNHSVSESVLAGYNDPLETIHRSRHDSRLGAVTPEVIRTRSHDGGHSVESHRSPSAGPVYHSRSHGGYHWNHATGSSINSFKAHSRVPESYVSLLSFFNACFDSKLFSLSADTPATRRMEGTAILKITSQSRTRKTTRTRTHKLHRIMIPTGTTLTPITQSMPIMATPLPLMVSTRSLATITALLAGK